MQVLIRDLRMCLATLPDKLDETGWAGPVDLPALSGAWTPDYALTPGRRTLYLEELT